MDPLFPKIQCEYIGTYLLFVRPHDVTRDAPSGPSTLIPIEQSSASNNASSTLRPVGRTSFRRSSVNLPPTTGSMTEVHGSTRAIDKSSPGVEFDSDDSQVKKKIKVASMDWQGQTFYITGKESVITVLRDTHSVRTLMEDGQLQFLINHVGDFANNYTADNFRTGIIKRHSKSALLAGMTLTFNIDNDLDRLQSLACYAIKELQDNLYFQKYAFPDARTPFSLCAEHYLTKTDADACNFEITTYDFWVRSWKGYQLVMELLLGTSYGLVISDIVNEIQQSNIGQYNDVGYLLSLTTTMRALLYEFSSSLEDFLIDTSIAVYMPASMTTALWIVVIQQLWLSFKEKLSYKSSAVRHKPFSGKVIKVSSGPSTKAAASIASRPTVTVTPTTKGRKDRFKSKSNKSPPTSRSSSPASSRGRKVEFGVAICISDLAKQYNIKSNLEHCKPDCPYPHNSCSSVQSQTYHR